MYGALPPLHVLTVDALTTNLPFLKVPRNSVEFPLPLPPGISNKFTSVFHVTFAGPCDIFVPLVILCCIILG